MSQVRIFVKTQVRTNGDVYSYAESVVVESDTHGGAHNDTIVTVERKLPTLFTGGRL
jgi:hypothetical protein